MIQEEKFYSTTYKHAMSYCAECHRKGKMVNTEELINKFQITENDAFMILVDEFET